MKKKAFLWFDAIHEIDWIIYKFSLEDNIVTILRGTGLCQVERDFTYSTYRDDTQVFPFLFLKGERGRKGGESRETALIKID